VDGGPGDPRLLPEGVETEWRDPSGRIVLAEVAVGPRWVGHRVTRLEQDAGVRVALLTRLGEGMLPGPGHGGAGGRPRARRADRGAMDEVSAVLAAGPETGRRLMRVAIAGAGNVGRSIAGELVGNGPRGAAHRARAQAMKVDSVPGAEWLLADACELETLVQARLQSCQVVVAATGDDKVNLVVSLLAKTEFGVERVVAKVNHPKNEWLFTEAWGVDVPVSSRA
jgi:hypothetical protein